MKNISISKKNWIELRRLRGKLSVTHCNDVITRLLHKDSIEVDNNKIDTKYDIQSAACSECHYEFDFVVDQNEMFLCCPKCGKTKKIIID